MTERTSKTTQGLLICNTCTIRLVQTCYKRTWWFIAFRTPMVWGMKIMAWWHDIDPGRHTVSNQACQACIRFMKNELKEKSPLFVWLNERINPVFNRVRDGIVTEDEKAEAKQFAKNAMEKQMNS
ncbi:MAG: nitroreductase [Fibrobacterota bacterium]